MEELRTVEEESHRRLVDAVVARVGDRHPGLRVHVDLLEGVDPSGVLLAVAQDATLLVVGARDDGAFPSALLGSTTRDVLRLAPGPVVVVPDGPLVVPSDDDAPGDGTAGDGTAGDGTAGGGPDER